MLRTLGTIFAALLGLAFGSFLNVCLSRWPEDESIVRPPSHCRTCNRTLLWWENIPILSWLALGGRCRTCNAQIHWRYPAVEATIGILWAWCAWTFVPFLPDPTTTISFSPDYLLEHLALFPLTWLLVALALLDLEHLWLPDLLTLPGIGAGLLLSLAMGALGHPGGSLLTALGSRVLAVLAAAALILLIRLVYWLFRRQEGIGLGDAKLMALLAAWLGLPGALLSFFIGVILGALLAVPLLIVQNAKHTGGVAKLPLGTFLCIGGIVTALWGHRILDAYFTWSGF